MNTLENIKVIAKFMGITVKKRFLAWNLYCEDGTKIMKFGLNSEKNLWNEFIKGNCFHTSWAYLMPVVEKIQSLRNDVDETGQQLIGIMENWFKYQHKNGKSKKELIYLHCIEFIKWYNKQK